MMYQSRALKKESATIFLCFSCRSIKNIDPLLQASANFWNWWVERSYKIRNWLKYGRKGGKRKTMLSAAFARVLLRASASVYRDTVLAPINRRPNHSESPLCPNTLSLCHRTLPILLCLTHHLPVHPHRPPLPIFSPFSTLL